MTQASTPSGGSPPVPNAASGAPQVDPASTLLALDVVRDGVIVTDAQGRITYLNAAAEALTGWSLPEACGRPASEVLIFIDEKSRERVADPVQGCLRKGRPLEVPPRTLLLHRQSQKEFSVEVGVTPVRQEPTKVGGLVATLRDVTELRGLSRLMMFQATHDPLTGLLNRREFEARLRARIEAARSTGQSHALCYLDLDQFHVINNVGGPRAGDQLLRQVAEGVAPRLRKADSFARIESDRFAVLLESCTLEQARSLADGLRESIREMRFPWDERLFEVSVSIGIIPVTPDSGNTADAMSAAASACEAAKQRGGNRVQVYRVDDTAIERQRSLVRWMRQVQQAVEHGRFQLLAQEIRPINPRYVGEGHAELLVRMLDDRGEVVEPHAFLAAAETYTLMPAVDRWVVRNAFESLERGAALLANLATCAVNLSGQSLSDPEFLGYVQERLRESNVAPERICFEITETAVIADLDSARHFISVLKGMGCRFSLDDFGSGLSSFGYLRDLPVDYLKIDGSFVRGMADDPTDRAMVESINQIGHVLGMRTIAEYVQDEKTLDLLKQMGVDFAQGSGIKPPLPVD